MPERLRPAAPWSLRGTLVWGLLFFATLYAVRLTGPLDFLDNDQERPTAYVLDILQNGRWACPRDHTGDVASKPPLVPWMSALFTLPAERPTRFELTLPLALATSRLFAGAGLCPAGRFHSYADLEFAFQAPRRKNQPAGEPFPA